MRRTAYPTAIPPANPYPIGRVSGRIGGIRDGSCGAPAESDAVPAGTASDFFLASSYVTVEGGQIRMEEFQGLIAPKPRWILQLLIEASGVVLFGVLFVACLITISRNLNNQTPIIEMPFWLFFAPLAVGSLLLMVETAVMFVHTWRRHRAEDKQTVLT